MQRHQEFPAEAQLHARCADRHRTKPRRNGEGNSMLHKTVTYRTETGWDSQLPQEMDGRQTLVLAFAASEFAAHRAPFTQLAAAFPQSVLVGCSTSGEIAGTQVHDASISVAVVRFDH